MAPEGSSRSRGAAQLNTQVGRSLVSLRHGVGRRLRAFRRGLDKFAIWTLCQLLLAALWLAREPRYTRRDRIGRLLGPATEIVQSFLGVPVDGIPGPVTQCWARKLRLFREYDRPLRPGDRLFACFPRVMLPPAVPMQIAGPQNDRVPCVVRRVLIGAFEADRLVVESLRIGQQEQLVSPTGAALFSVAQDWLVAPALRVGEQVILRIRNVSDAPVSLQAISMLAVTEYEALTRWGDEPGYGKGILH